MPEAWQRSFARLRSSNDSIEMVAMIPYALLLGAALSVVIALGRRGQLDWGGGLKLGLFIMALYFVMDDEPVAVDARGLRHQYFVFEFCVRPNWHGHGHEFSLALLVVIAVFPASRCTAWISRTGCGWGARLRCRDCAPRNFFAPA